MNIHPNRIKCNVGEHGAAVLLFEKNFMKSELIALLHRRIAIIADHPWRDRDAEGHLAALAAVSEGISTWTQAHRMGLDANLRHYLANASYQKALAHLEAFSEE